jgi:hypothetical protein
MCRSLAALLIAAGLLGRLQAAAPANPVEAGPLFHQFGLTLEAGEREEFIGPLFSTQEGEKGSYSLWTIAPFASLYQEPEIERVEFDFLYPALSYDRFGTEWRLHVAQFLNFHGGTSQDGEVKHRRNLFPFFFSQTSTQHTNDYWSLLPFYGHFQNHLFRDEVRFVAAPLYVWSRKGAMETDNYLFPFIHFRHGGGIQGWQILPLAGHETKQAVTRTNRLTDDPEVIPGYDKWFALFPFFHHESLNLGTTNEERRRILIPLYSIQRSPARDNTSIPWPFISHTVDREARFEEWGLPFPFIGWARGEGKHANRVWPLWGRATNSTLQTDFLLWPLYTHRLVRDPEIFRERTRILWFPYSDTRLVNPVTGDYRLRRDLWPLFSFTHDLDGRERLQVLAVSEPVIAGNQSIDRSWAPLWSLYRAEFNPKTGRSSQSLLWNLWRRDAARDSSHQSFLFGLIRTRRDADHLHWRFLWTRFATPASPSSPASRPAVPPAPGPTPARTP